ELKCLAHVALIAASSHHFLQLSHDRVLSINKAVTPQLVAYRSRFRFSASLPNSQQQAAISTPSKQSPKQSKKSSAFLGNGIPDVPAKKLARLFKAMLECLQD
ncbi:MAG: hypothetical protein AAGJ80_09765, partial [Cyanobacteria bacterium J06553_1]